MYRYLVQGIHSFRNPYPQYALEISISARFGPHCVTFILPGHTRYDRYIHVCVADTKKIHLVSLTSPSWCTRLHNYRLTYRFFFSRKLLKSSARVSDDIFPRQYYWAISIRVYIRCPCPEKKKRAAGFAYLVTQWNLLDMYINIYI